ncbi:hypothetical protein Tco_0727633 [Tanacetum coccineum]|uniref:Uncharacterized protein n=1 Tax=Tanacetum coccineum TaxID=301880 RepID=A0ABQ4YLD4_9ASTR
MVACPALSVGHVTNPGGADVDKGRLDQLEGSLKQSEGSAGLGPGGVGPADKRIQVEGTNNGPVEALDMNH